MKCKSTRGVLAGLLVYFGLLLLLISAASCSSVKPASSTQSVSEVKTEHTAIKDSTHVVEKLVERKVKVKADSSAITAQLEVDPATKRLKPFTASSAGARSKLTVSVDSAGRLSTRCDCTEEVLTVYTKALEIYRMQDRNHKAMEKILEYQAELNVKYIPYTAWYDYLARLLALPFVLFILTVIIRYLKNKYQHVKIFRR